MNMVAITNTMHLSAIQTDKYFIIDRVAAPYIKPEKTHGPHGCS